MNTQFKQELKGFYKVGVVNPETDDVRWHEEGTNLILNQGMDYIHSAALVNMMTYGICGVGTRPNSFGSGISHITQSNARVYLQDRLGYIADFTSSNSTYAATAEIGDMIVYQNNSQSQITSVLSDGFNLLVTPNYTFTDPQTFTIWKTSQTGLQSETSRSNSYVGGTGFCGTTVSTNVATHRRTYDFPILIHGPVSFNEIGIGWTGTALAPTVFSRILLGAPLTVPNAFRLRITYDLQTTWTPTSSLYLTASVGGWPSTIATQSLQNFLVSSVNVSNGASVSSNAFLEPYFVTDGNSLAAWVSPITTSLAAFGSYTDRSTGGSSITPGSPAAYTNGTYTYQKTWTFPITTGNGPIGSFGVGGSGGGYSPLSNGQVFGLVLNYSQSKYTTQTLSFTFQWMWDRNLS